MLRKQCRPGAERGGYLHCATVLDAEYSGFEDQFQLGLKVSDRFMDVQHRNEFIARAATQKMTRWEHLFEMLCDQYDDFVALIVSMKLL
jgi:hypothetical protein